MKQLGISLYPDKSEWIKDKEYLELAKKYGYSLVFMSFLQINPDNPKQSIDKIKKTIITAKQLGFSITMDIHPIIFKYLKKELTDLKYFNDLQIDTLRIDTIIDSKTEALMTLNPYGINIELNMSNNNYYLNHVLDYQPNLNRLKGSYNFYPQKYTGHSLKYFLECANSFKQNKIEISAFITSQKALISPWQISEGLCSLEIHRELDIGVQARHMKLLNVADNLIIGNAYATKEELKKVKQVMDNEIIELNINLNNKITSLEKEILFNYIHQYRLDSSDYMIRSSIDKKNYEKEKINSYQETKMIKKGDILILNENYGQYNAEVQIALKERIVDEKINVVGSIKDDELILLDELKPSQKFKFMGEIK